MVILDGKFVYADYAKEDTFESYLPDMMVQCIADLNDRRTFVHDTGIRGDVKVQETKKKMTLSQLYAERGVGVKFLFMDEPYVYEICGEDTHDKKKQVIVLDIWYGNKVVGTTTMCGDWYVEPM